MQLAAATVVKDLVPSKAVADLNISPNDTTLDQMSGVFASLMRRINILKIAIQTPPRVNVIQKASVPIKKEMKKQILGTGFGGILGFAIVGGLITLYEGRVRRVFGVKELTANPAVNLIGLLRAILIEIEEVIGAAQPVLAIAVAARVLDLRPVGIEPIGRVVQSLRCLDDAANEIGCGHDGVPLRLPADIAFKHVDQQIALAHVSFSCAMASTPPKGDRNR